jgi:glycosyltransferase involved in cell wall biosynthesis
VLVGDGPAAAELEALAGELGLLERVRFVPWTDDARAELAELDIFVLPSRNEGFPLSIIEAMLAGRPVIATDVGSVREAVDESTGIVVPPDDVAELRWAIEQLAMDSDRRRRLGAAARQRALERFTSAAMARASSSSTGSLRCAEGARPLVRFHGCRSRLRARDVVTCLVALIARCRRVHSVCAPWRLLQR